MGRRVHGSHAADSTPYCIMGFELRTPAEPTLLHLWQFAYEVQRWSQAIYLRNGGSILPARRDAQGTFHALDIQCPGLDPGQDPNFSIDYAWQGLPSPRKLRRIKERGCQLADKITLSTVGK